MAVSFFDGLRLFKIGRRYDKVFPVPVGAVTIILRFYSMQGITWVWTGVGLWNPRFYRP